MTQIADDVPEVEELWESLLADRLWVLEVDGVIDGYIPADIVDGNAYISHVPSILCTPGVASGVSSFARRGVGPRAGCLAMTLTPLRDVPWNAPY